MLTEASIRKCIEKKLIVLSRMDMAKTPEKKGKPQADRRSRAYTVRYNDEEDAIVEAAATERSLEVGSWIRMVSVQAAREQAKKGNGGGRG
jgi:hypothetical protein